MIFAVRLLGVACALLFAVFSGVAPTMSALLSFLTRENNGIRVYEEKRYLDANDREVFDMSNGLSYTKDDEEIKLTLLNASIRVGDIYGK